MYNIKVQRLLRSLDKAYQGPVMSTKEWDTKILPKTIKGILKNMVWPERWIWTTRLTVTMIWQILSSKLGVNWHWSWVFSVKTPNG